jgi:hypothetical protein
MDFKWEQEPNLYAQHTRDWNLETVEKNPEIIAFVRLYEHDGMYVCRFMAMEDNDYPDGKRYKTLKSAKAWCRKHAPVMYLAGKLGGSDDS